MLCSPIAGLFTDLPEILRFFPFMACMNLITGYSQNPFLIWFWFLQQILYYIRQHIKWYQNVAEYWRCEDMKKVFNSIGQVFQQIKKDP